MAHLVAHSAALTGALLCIAASVVAAAAVAVTVLNVVV
jgi:ABC-type Fe2+-enterobactin transport system substrate-binding protein